MVRTLVVLSITVLLSAQVSAADPAPAPAELKKTVEQGYAFLKSRQGADGSFIPKFTGPGGTALVAASLVKNGYPVDDPVVAKALAYVEKQVKDDGGIYDKGFATYTTSLAIMTFKEANQDKKYDKVIESAVKYLRKVQDTGGSDEAKPEFGGAGYGGGKSSRPDTSNTAFFLEALLAGGVDKNDPAVKNALTFLTRSQNLPSEKSDQPFARKVSEEDKGGFVYNLFEQDKKDSEKRTDAGGLRSEGGMTYAGLKSFLYAGVDRKDPRVEAAVRWVRNNYTLEKNPGMGTAGLYYYYHTFAKAMAALGEDDFADAKGVKHPWRKELHAVLAKAQKTDGSWANENKAFLENSPELATAFAMLSLAYCRTK